MELFFDPQAWLSLLTLAVLEIVLGIDNIIFLAVLVDRLPAAQRRSARLLGLGFAMLTRIALLFSVIWLASMRAPLLAAFGLQISARSLVLFAGGVFLTVNCAKEIHGMLNERPARRTAGMLNRFWLVIVQIGIIDIVFSLDSVFTAVGLANRVEVMVVAIVVSVAVMMVVSSTVSTFVERHPAIKVLALAFLVLVGGALIAQAFDREIPKSHLYFALTFAVAVEWVNARLRRRRAP